MKHLMKSLSCLLLAFALLFGSLPLSPLANAVAMAETGRHAEIPEAFSLAESPLDGTYNSGKWHYALRETDGYAAITGYTGSSTDVAVPALLDGHDVVAIAAGALPEVTHVTLHGNILFIAQDAFGRSRPAVTALNGTYGLYWASRNGLPFSTGRDYELVPGVVDYTDAPADRVRKRGDSHVWLGALEAQRLRAGSLLWMRDARDMEFYYRVVSLTPMDGGQLAEVVIPEVSDAIENLTTTVTVQLGAEDFIPAEGTVMEDAPATGKSVDKLTRMNEFPVSRKFSGKTHKFGRNDAMGFAFSGEIGAKISSSVTYTVTIHDGKVTASALTKKQSYGVDAEISCKASDDLLQQYSSAQASLDKYAKGTATESDASLLGRIFNNFSLGYNSNADPNVTTGYSLKDIEAFNKAIDNYNKELQKKREGVLDSAGIVESANLGSFTIQTPYFNISFHIDFSLSVKGSLKYSFTTTNVTSEHYDFASNQWVTDYSNGNSTSNEREQNLALEVKAELALSVEVGVGAFFTTNLSIKFSMGVSVGFSYPLYSTTPKCGVLKVEPFMELSCYGGLWVGKSTGVKIELFRKRFTVQDLLGKEYLLMLHINFALPNNNVHVPQDCPLDDSCTVKYNTRCRDEQVQSKSLLKGARLTDSFNVKLENDDIRGAFLGWALDPGDATATATFGSTGTLVKQSLTLYAVWENMVPVHFDTDGASAVEDQLVPLEGYAAQPADPVREGSFLLAWADESGRQWDFNRDAVAVEMTLTAIWDDGNPATGGTREECYIGDLNQVSNECIIDPYSQGQSSADYFEYEEFEAFGATAICITGIKNDPEHLVIPAQLPAKSLSLNSMLEVKDIQTGAFNNVSSLKSVRFLTGDFPQLTTDYMFCGCENLEYVELPELEDGLIGTCAFDGCENLKCVKARAGLKTIGSYAFSGTAISKFVPVRGVELDSCAFSGCVGLREVDFSRGDMRVIPSEAFASCTSLDALELGISVTEIDPAAFEGCIALESLYIPDNVKTLHHANEAPFSGPFDGCIGLREISVGGVDAIERGMFSFSLCQLEKLTIRDSVRRVDRFAFDHCCEELYTSAALVIEEGVEEIGEGAFYGCTGFISASLPSTLTSIEPQAFDGCENMVFDLETHRVDSIGAWAFQNCRQLASAKLDGVTTIQANAFYGCTGLKELDLGDAVTEIGQGAFGGCGALTTLYIPDSVKTLVHATVTPFFGPFDGCIGLREISVGGVDTIERGMFSFDLCQLEKLTIRGSVRRVGNSAFYQCFTWGELSAALVIEEGVEEIDESAFYGCTGFTSASLPSTLTSIEPQAFDGCENMAFDLETHRVDRIGDRAFQYCRQLASAKLDGVASIGAGAFGDCTGLKELDLGDAVTEIGIEAFTNCVSLETLYIPDSVKTLGIPESSPSSSPFYYCTGLREISVGGVDTIGSGMFSFDLSHLEKLTIRGSVRRVGNSAFYQCCRWGDLTAALVIEEGVEEIGEGAFRECTGFTSASLPSTLTSIESQAFDGCENMALDLEIRRLDRIGARSFQCCRQLASAKLDGVASIGEGTFAGCTGLKELDLGDAVTEIGVSAFSGCVSLETLYIPDSVKTLGNPGFSPSDSPFYGCAGLREISVGGVDTIEQGMLYIGSCPLEKLTIRGSVKHIAYEAFNQSQIFAATALVIEEGVEDIGRHAFYHTGLASVSLPASLMSVDDNAFSYCVHLTDMLVAGSETTFTGSTLEGCNVLTVHLGARNAALEDILSGQNIPYDFTTAIPFSLTLNPGNGGEVRTLSVNWGEALTLEEPEWEGHLFSGWYEDAALTRPWVGKTMPARDLELYGAWDLDVYTLTLDPGEGSLERIEYRVHAGDAVDFAAPVCPGFAFIGWSADGETPYTGVMPEADLTLIALWALPSEDGFYDLDDAIAVLTDFQGSGVNGVVYLPETVGGRPLTTIKAGAFEFSGAKTVVLPASLTTIETDAFEGCDSLMEFRVAADNPAFRSIDGVVYNKEGTVLVLCPPARRHVKIPDGILRIADRAFSGTALNSVRLPGTLAEIGNYAFSNTGLYALELPGGLESIGERAFSGCRRLASITATASPDTIGDYAFSEADPFLLAYGPDGDCALKRILLEEGYRYNAHTLTQNYPDGETTAFLDAGVTLALPGAPDMPENTWFTGWFLDEGAEHPFTDVSMPNADLTLYAGSGVAFEYESYESEPGETRLRVIACNLPGPEASIPESIGGVAVEAIGEGCFGPRHERVSVPSTVLEIADGAFANTARLICTADSYAATWAAQQVFETEEPTWTLSFVTGCPIEIEAAALHADEAITLPEPVRTGYALSGWCWDADMTEPVQAGDIMPARNVTLYADWTLQDADAADLAEHLTWALVDGSAVITGYNGEALSLAIPATLDSVPVTGIDAYAFAYCNSIVELTLPEGLTAIGARAFFGMHCLETLTLPAGVKLIPEEAFADCIALKAIHLPEGLETIGASAFARSGLESLALPASLKQIDASALRGCNALNAVDVAEGNAFYASPDGVLYDIADGVLVKYPAAREGDAYAVSDTYAIGAWAFSGANRLRTVTVDEAVCSVGEGAFENCAALTAMPEFGPLMTRIPDDSFRGCRSLAEATLPQTLKSIGERAFAGCIALAEVTVPDSATVIGDSAFEPDVLLRGSVESYARRWASANSVAFVPTDGVPAEAIAFEAEALTLQRGRKASVELLATPGDALLEGVRFTSSNPRVVRVGNDGTLSALEVGQATIFARLHGLTATCTVVVEVSVESVSIGDGPLALTVGSTEQLEAVVTPSAVGDSVLTWSSSDEAVATVDENGLVSALATGEATIRATANNGVYGERTVTVFLPAMRIALDPDKLDLFAGDSTQLVIIPSPEGTAAMGLAWSSGDEAVATVDANGLVTAHAPGEVTITAHASGGLEADCAVRVYNRLVQVTARGWIGNTGQCLPLSVSLEPDHLKSDAIRFVCQDESIATVSETGMVEAVAPGTTFIRVIPEADPSLACDVAVVCLGEDALSLPAALAGVSEESFAESSIAYVVVPEGAVSIGARAFADCLSLYAVQLPASVTTIARNAFDGCGSVAIIAPAASYAQDYAAAHGMPFIEAS